MSRSGQLVTQCDNAFWGVTGRRLPEDQEGERAPLLEASLGLGQAPPPGRSQPPAARVASVCPRSTPSGITAQTDAILCACNQKIHEHTFAVY